MSTDGDCTPRTRWVVLAEQDDEWQVAHTRYFSAGSMARIDDPLGGETPKELLEAIA